MVQNSNNKIVYSTNLNFEFEEETLKVVTLAPNKQRLTILLDTKQRKGKKVTLITGFIGSGDDLKTLGKQLKTKCGVGGTVKDGEIILQGDFRKKVNELLEKQQYRCKISGM